MFNMMCNVLHNGVVHKFTQREVCVMSFVCLSEMTEVTACLCRCTMWNAHQELSDGTVEQLCPIIFLSEISELKESAAEIAEMGQECVPVRNA